MSGRRDFPPATREEIKLMFDGYCFNCYANIKNSMQCAHIHSASSGNSVRNSQFVQPGFVSSSLNGVLACPNCHASIDDKLNYVPAHLLFSKVLDFRARKIIFGSARQQPIFSVWFYLNCAYSVIPILERLSRLREFNIRGRDDAFDACDELEYAEKNILLLVEKLQSGIVYVKQFIDVYDHDENLKFFNMKINYLLLIYKLVFSKRSQKMEMQAGNYQCIERNIDDVIFNVDACIYGLAVYFDEVSKSLNSICGCENLALRTDEISRPLVWFSEVGSIDLGDFNKYEIHPAYLLRPELPTKALY